MSSISTYIKSLNNQIEVMHPKTSKIYQSVEEAKKEIPLQDEVIITNNITAEVVFYMQDEYKADVDLKVSFELPNGTSKTKEITMGPFTKMGPTSFLFSHTAIVKTTLSNMISSTFDVVAKVQQKHGFWDKLAGATETSVADSSSIKGYWRAD
ncbi:MAG: hypothetical protein NZM44_04920 [Candidatus Calescibacterium sp.]|nr:hypothetical protein [Candidatus Calescibacterium sp.]MCX7758805.1 hypothetical protein [bacterium]